MKYITTFVLFFLKVVSLTHGQYFEGKIEYVQHEGYKTSPFATYFFNQHYIKKIDTVYDHFVGAGFSEVIWDKLKGTQYIVNHGTRTVYYYDYSKMFMQKELPETSSAGFVNGYDCLSYQTKKSTSFEFKEKPDTINHYSKFYFPKVGFSLFAIQSINEFESLGLSSGIIPIKAENSGEIVSDITSRHKNTIEALSVIKKEIPDSFFHLPSGYELKPYSEDEIKNLVSQAIRKKINFLEMAQKIIREDGWRKHIYMFDQ